MAQYMQETGLPKETMIIHSVGILFKRLKTVNFFSAGSSASKAALLLKQERRQQESEATMEVSCSSQHPGSPSSQLLRLTLKDTPSPPPPRSPHGRPGSGPAAAPPAGHTGTHRFSPTFRKNPSFKLCTCTPLTPLTARTY